MKSPLHVAVLLGSLRAVSYSRMLAGSLAALAPPELTIDVVELGDLPLFNEDLETEEPPPAWTRFRDAVRTADALLFVTPEYNRSIPAVLKNAIDVGSSPFGQSVWDAKPAAIVSQSVGAMGGFGANHHLRQSLVFANVPVMSQPEAYIGAVDSLFDADGAMTSASGRAFLETFMAAYLTWVQTQLTARRIGAAA